MHPRTGTQSLDVLVPRGHATVAGPWFRVAGRVRAAPGDPVSTVEVAVDGHVRKARAWTTPVAGDGEGAFDVCWFEALVELPDASVDRVLVQAQARTLGGRVLESTPTTVAVRRCRDRHVPFSVPAYPNGPSRLGGPVVFFANDLELGGAQLYLLEIVRAVGRSAPGHDMVVVSPTPGLLRDSFAESGAAVVVDGGYPTLTLIDLDAYEGRLAQLVAWLAGQAPSLVFVNTFGEHQPADAAARLGIPTFWSIHESLAPAAFFATVYGEAGFHPHVLSRARAALAAADRVYFESMATRQLYAADGAGDNAVVDPYGVDGDGIALHAATTDRGTARRELGIEADAFLFVCLGTVEPRKSQLGLVRAFAEVARLDPRLHLAIVGARGGFYAEAVAALIHACGLDARVRLLPYDVRPLRWFSAGDALVCASDVESLPFVILEAMAHGIPVAATRIFGVPDLIRDGETGYLCEPRDLGALIEMLRRVVTASEEERSAVAAAGRRLVRASYRLDEHLYRVLGILDTLAAEGASTVRASTA
jgi:D-inositol-3-phosphate glycosyltransferase